MALGGALYGLDIYALYDVELSKWNECQYDNLVVRQVDRGFWEIRLKLHINICLVPFISQEYLCSTPLFCANICQLCWISEGGVDESFWAVCVCTMEGHKTRKGSYITINLAPFLICVLLPSQSLLALHNGIFDMLKFEPSAFNPRALT